MNTICSKNIILQGFNWGAYKNKNWNKNLKNEIKHIKDSGITKIWLPPISKSHSEEGYFPDDYYNYNSEYGSATELWDLVDTCNDHGVDPIADIISWTCLPSFCREKFNFNGKLINDDSKWDMLIDWSYDIHNKGIKGYRLDMAGIVPSSFIDQLPENTFIVSELWETMNYTNELLLYNQDSHRQSIVDYIDKNNGKVHAFDFTLKGILQEAINKQEYWRLQGPNGEPYGVHGWYPEKSVTFIDNHDTYGQMMWPFGNNYVQGYAYILFHDGTPCIYYDHYNDHIRYLILLLSTMDTNLKTIIHEANNERYIAQKGNWYIQLGYNDTQERNTVFDSHGVKIWKV